MLECCQGVKVSGLFYGQVVSTAREVKTHLESDQCAKAVKASVECMYVAHCSLV